MNMIIEAYGFDAYSSNGGSCAALKGCVTVAAMLFLIKAILAPNEQEVVEEADPAVILKK